MEECCSLESPFDIENGNGTPTSPARAVVKQLLFGALIVPSPKFLLGFRLSPPHHAQPRKTARARTPVVGFAALIFVASLSTAKDLRPHLDFRGRFNRRARRRVGRRPLRPHRLSSKLPVRFHLSQSFDDPFFDD